MALIIANKYAKVDPNRESFLGYQYERVNTKGELERSVEKRCDYCGRWMCFDVRDVWKWGDNIKRAFNGLPEKVHCESEHCKEYHARVIAHEAKEATKLARQSEKLFFSLMHRKAIS